MTRALSWIIGPELVLVATTAATYWFCARHNSAERADILLLEKLLWILPLVVVPLVFATIFVPGAKHLWWLARAVVWTLVALSVCGGRIISGFGDGAKGQDAAFIIVIAFGLFLLSPATAVTGAMILADTRPGFAAWFQERRVLGSILTLLASIPLGLGIGFIFTVGLGVLVSAWSAFKR